jgi:hypothetical protein
VVLDNVVIEKNKNQLDFLKLCILDDMRSQMKALKAFININSFEERY